MASKKFQKVTWFTQHYPVPVLSMVGLGCSFLFIGIAMFGHLPPAIGAMLQEVLYVSVILNALRAR